MSDTNIKYDSKIQNVNYVFILPNVAIYLKYFFDFISEKQVQIYASFSDQVKVQMITTCYFPPQNIVDYINNQLPDAILSMHGTMRFQERKKKVKRPYTKRKIKTNPEPKANGNGK